MSATSGTARTTEELMYLFRDGQPSSAITAQDMRDFVASIPAVQGTNDITASGALADGRWFLDGIISASSTNLISGSADFTGREGQTVFVQGAGAGGSDLLTTIVSVNNASSCVLSAAAGTTVSGAEVRYGTDNTAAIQAAIDAIGAGSTGGKLIVPRGVFLTTGPLNILPGVSLEGDSWGPWSWSRLGSSSLLMCCANTPVIRNLDTEGDGWYGSSIRYLSFRGTTKSGSKGIYSARSGGLLISYCSFDTFGDHAIHLQGGVFTAHIKGISAISCHLVRSKLTYVGVVDIEPSDVVIADCELTSSEPEEAEHFGNGKIAALAIRGGNSFVRDCQLHHSQIGCYVGPGASGNLITLVNVRCDRNQGHGFVVDGFSNNFIGCRSHSNVIDAEDTYSGFLINGGGNTFHSCQVTSNVFDSSGPVAGRYKHAFLTTNASNTSPNEFFFNHIGNDTGPFYQFSDVSYKFAGTQTNQIVVRSQDGAGVRLGREVLATGTVPKFTWINEDGDTDEKNWGIFAANFGGGVAQLSGSTLNDAADASAQWFIVVRTGIEIDYVLFRGGYVKIDGPLELKNGARHLDGAGDPNGSVTGNIGYTYSRSDGGAVTSFYVKESGNGTNTGWVGK